MRGWQPFAKVGKQADTTRTIYDSSSAPVGFEHRQVLRQLPVCLLGRLKFDFFRVHLR